MRILQVVDAGAVTSSVPVATVARGYSWKERDLADSSFLARSARHGSFARS